MKNALYLFIYFTTLHNCSHPNLNSFPEAEQWTTYETLLTSLSKSWRTALDLEVSTYVGRIGKVLSNLPLADIRLRPDLVEADHHLLARENDSYLSYLVGNGCLPIKNLPEGLSYHWINPKTGRQSGPFTTEFNKVLGSPKP